jgi:hypothetical protein
MPRMVTVMDCTFNRLPRKEQQWTAGMQLQGKRD